MQQYFRLYHRYTILSKQFATIYSYVAHETGQGIFLKQGITK